MTIFDTVSAGVGAVDGAPGALMDEIFVDESHTAAGQCRDSNHPWSSPLQLPIPVDGTEARVATRCLLQL